MVSKAGQGEKSILIVDNQPAESAQLGKQLSYAGFRVTSVTTGEGAIKKMGGPGADVILLEVELSDMDGLNVVSFVRNEPRVRHTPIVAMSAFPHRKDRCLEGGCDGFVQKPVRILDLVAHIRRLTR